MSQTAFPDAIQRALALFDQGAMEEAFAAFEQAKSLDPANPRPWIGIGDVFAAKNEIEKAAEAYDAALQRDPGNYLVAINLGRALAMIGDYGACYYVLDHAEKLRPNDPAWMLARLEVARARRDWGAMETLATQLIRVAPLDATGWRDLAAAYFEAGRYADAATAFGRVLEIAGRSGESLAQYATLCIQALDFDKAQKAIDEAEALDPENPRVLSTKALLLTYMGRKDEAEAYCRRCIEADPTFMSVYPQLSVIRNGRLEPDERARLKDYSRRDDVATGARSSASFVLAHSYDADGQIDAAFSEYAEANRLAAERNVQDQLYYNHEGLAEWTDAIINVFQHGAEPDAESYHDGPQPIFIVGLPRSGSTLVESVLAAHSQVTDGGEMPMMPQQFNDWLKANHQRRAAILSDDERRAMAAQYMAGVHNPGEGRFTDKNLLNIEAAGMIAQIFPKAKIVNIRRSPLEAALSIWRHDLPKFWAYATSLDDIAARYGLYARLVAHFEGALGDRFITVQYEDFVDNFAAGARELIAWCGLDWEEACANPQHGRDVAATLSAVQVRGAVERKSDRAAAYAAHLAPLRAGLEAAGVDLATGRLKN